MRGIAEAAGRVLGKDVKVRVVPMWLAKAVVASLRPFSRNAWELGQFFVGMGAHAEAQGMQLVAPATGSQHLEDYFRQRWAEEQKG